MVLENDVGEVREWASVSSLQVVLQRLQYRRTIESAPDSAGMGQSSPYKPDAGAR